MKIIYIEVSDLVIGVVYRYWNETDDGKCYVGCTLNEKKRKYAWNWKNNPYGGTKIAKARRLFGLSAFQYEQLRIILGSSEKDVLSKLEDIETAYIVKFDSFNNGYNSSLGGHGNKGLKMGEAYKQKLRDKSKKKPVLLIPDDGSEPILKESFIATSRDLKINVGNVHYYIFNAPTKSIKGYKLRLAA